MAHAPGINIALLLTLIAVRASARAIASGCSIRSSPRGGTGMGLGIARSMVLAHGGTIVLMPSAQEGGASFELILPSGPVI